MKLTELGVGDVVFLEFGEGDARKVLKSSVHDIVYDGAIVYIPDEGNLAELEELGRLSIRVKSNNRMHSWSNLQIKTKKLLGKDALILRSEAEGHSGNLRDAYRVGVYKKLDFGIAGREKEYSAVVKDISLVGIGLLTLDSFKEGTLLEMLFEDLDFKLPIKAEVVRRVKEGNLTLHGCKIIKPSKELQRYINAKQRNEFKK